jgi:hypothetical protein
MFRNQIEAKQGGIRFIRPGEHFLHPSGESGARIEIIQKLETAWAPHEFCDQPSGIGAMPLDQRVQFDILLANIEREISAVCLRGRRGQTEDRF